MAGFANGGAFTDILENAYVREITERLAEIERSDADICANCGGEDCICCEIYRDRMAWDDPVDFYAQLEYEFC